MAIRLMTVLLILSCLGQLCSQDDESLKSQFDPVTSLRKTAVENAYRVLYIGDSITLHGTSSVIVKKLQWDHVAGMAASTADVDYAHLFASKVAAALPTRTIELYFHTLGGSGTVAQRLSAMAQVLPLEPHLVVVQLGEHEKEAAGIESFRVSYDKLLASFDSQPTAPIIVCAGVWNPYGKGTYTSYRGWPAALDQAMSTICAARKIPFAPVAIYALDPACSGSGSSSGVRWHPNDQGHRGYADALFAVVSPRLPR